MKQKKIELLNYQIIASILFIISLLISIFLTYDEKLEITGNKRIFNKYTDKVLNLSNRIFALLIVLFILYINYEDYILNKIKRNNTKTSEHQIIASFFSVISAIIVLYVVIENWYENPNITSIENPIV